jgi:CMP-N-acetylneuraminate monooxygenase
MDNFKTLGFFETINSIDTINISLSKLKIGINDIGNYILKLNNDRTIDYVIDKVCDHAGGRLIVKGEQAICPMHNWKLNLDSLKYNNDICKKSLDAV